MLFRVPRSVMARTAGILAAMLLFPLPTMVTHAPVGAATLPTVSVNDVSITEGTGSTKTLTFTVTQSARAKSRVSFTTVRDTAKAPADFLVKTGSVRFAGNKLTKTVSVTIVGDAFDEPDETFFLELTGATGATIEDGEGIGTIQDDDLPPVVQVPPDALCPRGSERGHHRRHDRRDPVGTERAAGHGRLGDRGRYRNRGGQRLRERIGNPGVCAW